MELINFNCDTTMLQKTLDKMKNTAITKIERVIPSEWPQVKVPFLQRGPKYMFWQKGLEPNEERYYCYNIEDACLGFVVFYNPADCPDDYDTEMHAYAGGNEHDVTMPTKQQVSSSLFKADEWSEEFISAIKSINYFYNSRRKKQLYEYCDQLSKVKDGKCVNCRSANKCYQSFIRELQYPTR